MKKKNVLESYEYLFVCCAACTLQICAMPWTVLLVFVLSIDLVLKWVKLNEGLIAFLGQDILTFKHLEAT